MRIFIICLVAFLMFSGCTSKPKAPRHYHNSYHIVEKGDTLHSISWRYGVDAKQLAHWNNIPRPYTIYPGQKLRVNSTAPIRGARSDSKSSSSKSSIKTSKPVKSIPVGDWRWPLKGKLLSKFSGTNNGIDIVAKEGAVVSAASAGKVVYAGSGLRGYGNLLIIKHNSSYFSAYAHSRKLLVGEGDIVKIGQKIAEVGSTGTDRAKLHFEIRKDGNPVDPLKYLPR
ncbi:MAG: peptidoglycan DD-metalloendopeptidase family protein [Gammaproteobacteria bacterium]|nr:peptidoglycan DD-metalloendopeptidase family protein [Gammaproteobacteria bacterium]